MDFLPAIEIETGPNPSASIIWLHGLGADGNDFVPIVKELEFSLPCPTRFVFPHAPTLPVTINGGYIMPAWYDILLPDMSLSEDEKGIRRTQLEVDKLIARERSRGIAAGKIMLAGFSQGGAVALFVGLRYPEKLAGILALSTYLPLHAALPSEAQAANSNVPIFMAHGTLDTVVPLWLGRLSRDRLIHLGYQVEWHEFPMAHSVCMEEVTDIGAFLTRAFGWAVETKV
jgi:phospholipase/carboxylesterase